MKMATVQFKKIFLFFSFFYYVGFLSFITGIYGGKVDDAFTVYAGGSIANQLWGIGLLIMSVTLICKLKIVTASYFVKSFFLWGLLIAWFVASISWSYAPAISFRRVVAFSSLVLVSFCLVQMFTAKSLLRFFVVAVFIASCIGILEAILYPQNAFIGSGIRAGAFTGFYFDKNGGARVYAYSLLIIVGLEFYKERWGLAALLAISTCLLMSRSATAAIMLIVGCLLIFMFKYWKANTASTNFLRLGLLLVVLTISGYTLLLLHDVLLEFLGRDATLTNRTIIWQLIEPYILKEFIFGYGFGAFWASDAVFGFLDRWSFIGNAHSGYYEAMLQGGIVCLLIVLAIAFKSLYLLFKAYIVGKSGALTATLIAIFCIQLAVNFIGFIVLNHNSVDMFLFLLAFFMINSLPSSNQEIELKK